VKPPILLVDSNEVAHKHAYEFKGYETETANLYTGDYSIKGYENEVAVERKTKGDWYGCLAGKNGRNRTRFKDCLGRLAAMRRSAVVIECDLADLAVPISRTRLSGSHALGAYVRWQAEFGFPFVPCPSRDWAERFTLRFLLAYWEKFVLTATPRAADRPGSIPLSKVDE
jgi:ERCC4-type nuclease